MAYSWHIHRRPPTSTDVHPVGRPACRRPPTSTDVHGRPHLSASQAENAGSIPVARSGAMTRELPGHRLFFVCSGTCRSAPFGTLKHRCFPLLVARILHAEDAFGVSIGCGQPARAASPRMI